MKPVLVILALALTLTASIGAVSAGSSGPQMFPIDKQSPLTQQPTINQFQSTGHVTANFTQLELSMTVAKHHKQANISGFHADPTNTYVCLDYRESIPRTLRIYVPASYFEPRPNTGIDAFHSAPVLELSPTKDAKFTVLTVTFSKPGRSCWGISKEAGIYFRAKRSMSTAVNNSTGFSLPSLSGERPWNYLPPHAFDGNSDAYALATQGKSMTLQFDAADNTSQPQWLTVPKCNNPGSQQVCKFRKAGHPNTVYLLSTRDSPPTVRYKRGHDLLAGVGSSWTDLKSIPGDFGGWLHTHLGVGGGKGSRSGNGNGNGNGGGGGGGSTHPPTTTTGAGS